MLATVQALPGPLPPLSWPDLSVDTVRSLFGATLVMTLLALTEATAIAKAVARQYDDTLDGNREFIGQGPANIVGSFFSSMPASGSFNRSGVNVEAGARTPLAAASAALFLVLILGAVAPLAKHLPLRWWPGCCSSSPAARTTSARCAACGATSRQCSVSC